LFYSENPERMAGKIALRQAVFAVSMACNFNNREKILAAVPGCLMTDDTWP
jgi:hypothetical protein